MEGQVSQPDRRRGLTERFVLLVPKPALRPAKLIDAMRQRGVVLRLVHDVAQAIVEVAQFRPRVLVIHDPAHLDRAGQLEPLLLAIRTYYPHVVCWRHEPANGQHREHLAPFVCMLPQSAAPRLAQATLPEAEPATPSPQPRTVKPEAKPTLSIAQTPRVSDDAPFVVEDSDEPVASFADLPQSSHGLDVDLPEGLGPTAAVHGDDGLYTARNGHHNGNGHHRDRHSRPRRHAGSQGNGASLGQRLASSRAASADEGAADPLLSAEEIDMLRGPITPQELD